MMTLSVLTSTSCFLILWRAVCTWRAVRWVMNEEWMNETWDVRVAGRSAIMIYLYYLQYYHCNSFIANTYYCPYIILLHCYGALIYIMNVCTTYQYWCNTATDRHISCTVHKGNSRAISNRCMEITQELVMNVCYDWAIYHEFGNIHRHSQPA